MQRCAGLLSALVIVTALTFGLPSIVAAAGADPTTTVVKDDACGVFNGYTLCTQTRMVVHTTWLSNGDVRHVTLGQSCFSSTLGTGGSPSDESYCRDVHFRVVTRDGQPLVEGGVYTHRYTLPFECTYGYRLLLVGGQPRVEGAFSRCG